MAAMWTSHHTTKLFYTLLCSVLMQSYWAKVQGEYLFRVSPGGDGYASAGLWGGTLDLNQNGKATNLYSHGYDTLNTSYSTYYGIDMEYISHDPITGKVLMIVEEPDGAETSTKHSMALGPLCKEECAPLDATFQNFKLTDNNNPFLMDQDCDSKCGWGPFAYHDSKIYFLLSAVFGTRYDSLSRQIQIRVLEGCDDIIDEIKNQGSRGSVAEFPVNECSKLIKVIHEEQYLKPNSRPKVWVTSDLRIVYSANGNKHFFTQLINDFDSTSKLELLHVFDDGQHMLHSQPVDALFTGKSKVKGIGSVDFRDGYLCWTATESLYCVVYHLNGHFAIGPTEVLSGQEAVNSGICQTGILSQEPLRRTLTGVAIADTRESLSIYFGCYANSPATGGVGLIKIYNHGLTKLLYQVKSGSHTVFGGSLFLTGDVDRGCSYYSVSDDVISSPSNEISGGSTWYYSSEKSAGGNVPDCNSGDSWPVLSSAGTTSPSIVTMYTFTFATLRLVFCN